MKKGIISTLIIAVAGISAMVMKLIMNKKIVKRDETLEKVHELYMLFDQ